MRQLPTLRREIIFAFALLFAGAMLVAVVGVVLLLPRFQTPAQALVYLALLVTADVAVFMLFGRALVRQRLLHPLDGLVESVESIARGEYQRRATPTETEELSRLGEAVNRMAARLVSHQEQLAANVQSLEETNRQLTEARDELVRAEKLASVGRLGAGIAHEVGNPLGAILGYLTLIGRSVDASTHELVQATEKEVRRIDRIVRGLLDYARPHEVKVQPIAVNAVVEQALDLLSTQGRFGRVHVQLELGAELPAVAADPYQLQQVLVNLLLNATDALEDTDHAAIDLRTGVRAVRPRWQLSARRKDDPPDVDYSHRRRFHHRARVPRDEPFPPGMRVVEIVVADNGPGIPGELLEEIFEPFVTTKEPGKGTGLGLAVAARLIDAMGGTIRAENGDAGGARFTIALPAASEAAVEPTAAASTFRSEQGV
ncbi:MAG: HAMP domain-containing protein [Gemmatimonadetes bacterium]|nr:HAMP domain-containing protein [Gemmatimonadota bacterium]